MDVGLVSFTDIDYGLDLANALFENGANVSLYMSLKHTARVVGESARPVERIYELGLLPPVVKLHLFDTPRMRDLRSLHIVRKLSQTIRKDKVDIIHILVGSGEIWMAILANLLRDLPVTATMREPVANVGERIPASIVFAVDKVLTWGAKELIVNGANHVAQVAKLYHVPMNHINYIPLGPRTTTTKWVSRIIPEDPGNVLFYGRIDRHKGLEFLVKAQPAITKSCPSAQIVIAGNGKEELERCRGMIQDNSRFEIFDGFVPSQTTAELFQRASVVVLPYLSASTSGVLMTAQVFGKPVIVSKVGSLPEYVQDGETGILITPGNVEELAEAVIRLLTDETLRKRLGENAARLAQAARKQSVECTLKVYQKTISQRNNTSKGSKA